MGAAPRFLDFLFGDVGFRLARGRHVGVLASGEGHASVNLMFDDVGFSYFCFLSGVTVTVV